MISRDSIHFTLAWLLVLPVLSRAYAQTIYWTDVGTSKVQRLNLNASTGVEDLLTMGQVFTAVDLVMDQASGKIYWTEGSLADFMISRANLDGTGAEFLITGLTSSSGIALEWRTGPSTGACCFGNGFCTPQTQVDCEAVEGQLYLGDGTECVGDFTCPAVCWSCQCIDGFSDSDQSAIGCVAEESGCDDLCQAHGGLQSSQCDLGPCAPIPTVSEWGLFVMILLTLTAGTIVLRPRVRVHARIEPWRQVP